MSDLTNEQLLDLTRETLSWGSEVADMWAGTLYEKQIDIQREQVEKSAKENDLDKVRALVYDLAQFLDHAEKEYESNGR